MYDGYDNFHIWTRLFLSGKKHNTHTHTKKKNTHTHTHKTHTHTHTHTYKNTHSVTEEENKG